jgi:hypothetical protein
VVRGGVFINYRGEDSSAYAALLHAELARRFGPESVFLDTESIPAGADFVAQLLGRVRRARVVLAVIGARWLDAAGQGGGRLIDDPADWVRRELVVFTQGSTEADRQAMLRALICAAESPAGDPAPALVLLGLRADFYTHCARIPELMPHLQDSQIIVPAMTADEQRQAITAPAEAVCLRVEPALTELLLAEASDQALPQLAHVLRQAFAHRQGRTLTVEGYQATGGIAQAVATTADTVHDTLDDAGQKLLRQLMTALVAVTDGAEDTRRRVPRDQLLGTDAAAAQAGAAFSPDGTTLATTSDDGTARLWNAHTGHPTATLTGHTGPVWAVAFSPDGTTLATTSSDNTAQLWNAPQSPDDEQIEKICNAAGRGGPGPHERRVVPIPPTQPAVRTTLQELTRVGSEYDQRIRGLEDANVNPDQTCSFRRSHACPPFYPVTASTRASAAVCRGSISPLATFSAWVCAAEPCTSSIFSRSAASATASISRAARACRRQRNSPEPSIHSRCRSTAPTTLSTPSPREATVRTLGGRQARSACRRQCTSC